MSAKVYTWTPSTDTGLLNDEFEKLWDEVLQLVGGTMTGTLVLSGDPAVRMISGSLDSRVRINDGSGRFLLYWNSTGSGSPTYIAAGEAAMAVSLNPNVDSILRVFHAWDDGHSAGGALTWQTTLRHFRTGGVMTSLDYAGRASADLYYTATAGREQGSWFPYIDSATPTDYRVVTQVREQDGTVDTSILGDPHDLKTVQAYRNSALTVSGGSVVTITWNGTYMLDDVYSWAASPNPTRVTINNGGWYELALNLLFENTTATGLWKARVRLMINGAASLITYSSGMAGTSGDVWDACRIGRTHFFAAGDYLEVDVMDITTAAGQTVRIPASPVSTLQLQYRGAWRA